MAFSRRRRRKVDRTVFCHTYTGPTTRWGLDHGTPVRDNGKWRGGLHAVATPDGRLFKVPSQHLELAAA